MTRQKPCIFYGIDSGGISEEIFLSVAQVQIITLQETETESAN